MWLLAKRKHDQGSREGPGTPAFAVDLADHQPAGGGIDGTRRDLEQNGITPKRLRRSPRIPPGAGQSIRSDQRGVSQNLNVLEIRGHAAQMRAQGSDQARGALVPCHLPMQDHDIAHS